MNISFKLKFVLILGAFLVSSFTLSGLTITGNAVTNSSSASNQDITIHFSVGTQTTNVLQGIIDDFNANFSSSYGFKVALDENAFSTTSQHDTYVADFQAQSSAIDVISMDVIWPAEFANSGYIVSLDDVFNTSYQAEFLQAPIQAGTVNGHIYGVPEFHDSAMLYYRTDVLQYANDHSIISDPNGAPPTTWAQLHDWTIAMLNDNTLKSTFNITDGFVWQANSYEGLMCDFMEYIGGTGTYSFLNSDQTSAIFNTSTGISDALKYMKSLIDDGASPAAVTTYGEEESRAVWNSGNAIFMRNWPYAYALSLNSQFLNGTNSGGDQVFAVTTMPAKDSSVTEPRTSCLGGWQLGVSAFSQHQAEAKKFVMWVTAARQQLTLFLGNGLTPTLKSVYSDPAIAASSQSYVTSYLPVFEAALPRPVSPFYPQMSAKIFPILNGYLGGSIPLSSALGAMQRETDKIINAAIPPSAGIDSPIAVLLIVLGLGTIVTLRKKKNNEI